MNRQAAVDYRAQWRRSSEANPLWTDTIAELSGVTTVPICSVLPGDSPRLAGEDPQHIRALAETAEELPPVLVHRPSMKIIDGMHRLHAAVLRGQDTITVRFFDGSADEAFVIAVRANASHGLPLSLADRQAAAERIVAAYPHWSNRAVARATGLAPNTVGVIRVRTGKDVPSPSTRVGQDGRARPVNGAEGRHLAHQMILDNPGASLREIAKTAGISAATVRDVRERMRLGKDPIPSKQRAEADEQRQVRRNGPARSSVRRMVSERDPMSILNDLTKDPSLRFTESGRALLRWLNTRAAGVEAWETFVSTIPPHCTYVVADLARSCGEQWLEFSDQLRKRTNPAE